MSEYIQMKNILVTKIQRDEHRTILEVCFENMHEPKYCRLFKATLEKEGEWIITSIAVYDTQKDRFLTVGSLYAPIVYEEVKYKILQTFDQEDTLFTQQMAQ